MTDPRLPADVSSFIAAHIHSIEQLEVLLLLQRDPSRWMDGDEVAAELATHPASANQRLEDLHGRGLLARQNSGKAYRFAPRTPELARTTEALAETYRTRRVTVIGLIFSKPPTPLQDFSAAFDLRKDKPR